MPEERRSGPSVQSPALDAAVDKLAEKLRADPKTLERERAFARMRDELHLDEEAIARCVGVHHSVVSRLLALVSPDASTRIELAQLAAKEQLTVGETERRVREAAKSASAPTEIRKTAPRESTNSVHSPEALVEPSKPGPVAAQATIEDVPRWEIERRMQLSGALTRESPAIEQKIASWCITVGSLVRGPLRDAIWEFYERMTEAATWWRIIKRVLHFLARFIPGREPEPTKLQKAIKECFSFLHEPPPSEPNRQPKKPDRDPKQRDETPQPANNNVNSDE